MILTGKAKEDFLEYLDVEEKWFNEEYIPLFEHALIIEWFDSVGIYIEIVREDFGFGFNVHRGNWRNPDESLGHWKTRQEATKQAIIKVNQIYNNLNK